MGRWFNGFLNTSKHWAATFIAFLLPFILILIDRMKYLISGKRLANVEPEQSCVEWIGREEGRYRSGERSLLFDATAGGTRRGVNVFYDDFFQWEDGALTTEQERFEVLDRIREAVGHIRVYTPNNPYMESHTREMTESFERYCARGRGSIGKDGTLTFIEFGEKS